MEVDSNDLRLDDKKKSWRQVLRNDMLNYLCKSEKAHFKSQQLGDPELLDSEKRAIAESVLDRNYGTFLARFGSYIQEKHLEYFNECCDDQRYEVDFYLGQLRAAHNKAVSRVKVKNRRFEALKRLVSEGSYFSEYEMKKRNPLLYEQLVGQFLTEEEEKERTGIDTSNITFVNLLLEQFDREEMKKLKQRQEEDEENQREDDDDDDNDDDHYYCVNNRSKMDVDYFDEEIDSDDEDNSVRDKMNRKARSRNRNQKRKQFDSIDDDDDDSSCDFNGSPINKSLWGEEMTEKSQPRIFPCNSVNSHSEKSTAIKVKKKKVKIHMQEKEENDNDSEMTEEERNLLMMEFRSSMFNNFLEGNDTHFNYCTVDENSDYDDIDMRDEDEQEKYFDSETPYNVSEKKHNNIKEGIHAEDVILSAADNYPDTSLSSTSELDNKLCSSSKSTPDLDLEEDGDNKIELLDHITTKSNKTKSVECPVNIKNVETDINPLVNDDIHVKKEINDFSSALKSSDSNNTTITAEPDMGSGDENFDTDSKIDTKNIKDEEIDGYTSSLKSPNTDNITAKMENLHH